MSAKSGVPALRDASVADCSELLISVDSIVLVPVPDVSPFFIVI